MCLLITGQLRTYKTTYKNILKNLIDFNKDEYNFHIYILTDTDSRDDIVNVYGDKLVKLLIESEENPIEYPDYININRGAWRVLYRNKILYDNIYNKSDYDIFIRMRPDIILTSPINLNKLIFKDNIHIVSGNSTRDDSACNMGSCWLHNRDWDYMNITDEKGMRLWCDFYKYLEINKPYEFNFTVKYNYNGYWATKTDDNSIIATQLFFKNLEENNYNLVFDSADCFSEIIR